MSLGKQTTGWRYGLVFVAGVCATVFVSLGYEYLSGDVPQGSQAGAASADTGAGVPTSLGATSGQGGELLASIAQQLAVQAERVTALESRLDALGAEASAFAVQNEEEVTNGVLATSGARGLERVRMINQQRRQTGKERRDRLLETGMAPNRADEVLAAVDQLALERVELRYQAAREGWLNSDRYREAVSALPSPVDQVRERFGEQAVDQFLYARGRPNRVVVGTVLEGSAALEAGLQAGDVVRRYDDTAIYNLTDVLRAASEGEPGALVEVVVERAGEQFTTYANRGPLGIQVQGDLVNPGAR